MASSMTDVLTIWIVFPCVLHAGALVSKGGLTLVDEWLIHNRIDWRFFSATAKLIYVWRDSIKTIFAAWLVQVGEHRYTESLRHAINELALEASILASIGEEAQQGRVADPITCGLFGTRMVDLVDKREELKTTVDGHVNPKKKVVKRNPSDPITEPSTDAKPPDAEPSAEPPRPEAASSDGEERFEDSQVPY